MLCSAGRRCWSGAAGSSDSGTGMAMTGGTLVAAAAPTVLKLLFLVYPLVTTVAFQSFPCYDFGPSGQWLIADVAVQCATLEHTTIMCVAWV